MHGAGETCPRTAPRTGASLGWSRHGRQGPANACYADARAGVSPCGLWPVVLDLNEQCAWESLQGPVSLGAHSRPHTKLIQLPQKKN